MPAVTTSSATGSRVLQKPMSTEGGNNARDSLAEEGKADRASLSVQQTSPSKRASGSSTMSSKIKRFPTLLSRKESRSKGESTSNGGAAARSTSNGDGRRKSLANDGHIPKPSTPQSHNRSISLASATPSSLPRPVASAGLPSSATSPNLTEAANGYQPSSPSNFGASPKRVPAPGQESGIPRLITSPRSASGSPSAARWEQTVPNAEEEHGPSADLVSSSSNTQIPAASSTSEVIRVAGNGDAHDFQSDKADASQIQTPSVGKLFVVNGNTGASPDLAKSEVRYRSYCYASTVS